MDKLLWYVGKKIRMNKIHPKKPIFHRQASGSRPTIGVLSHGFADNRFWCGLADAARQRDVNLIGFAGGMLASPHGFEAQANVLFDLVNPEVIDGLIVDFDVLCHYVGVQALQTFCERYPLPIVSSGVPFNGIPSVLLDFAAGMRDVLRHLIEVHGYRRIAFIRGPATSQSGEDRYAAYQDVLTAHDIPFDPQLVAPGTFYAPSGAAAVRILLDERRVSVDAIVAANDFMALDAIHALRARGIRTPEDVAVVGFDDIEEASALTPPLTTANFQIYARSQRLMDMLIAIMAGQPVAEQVSLVPQLIVRESCGCPSAAVMQAVTTVQAHGEADLAGFAAQRELLVSAMAQAVSGDAADQQRVAWLFDSFAAEQTGDAPGAFLAALNGVIRQTGITGGNLTRWQSALSVLRRGLKPGLSSWAAVSRAEDVWQQARILLGEASERAQIAQKIQVEQQFVRVREISQALIATFDVAELMHIVARELPRVGVPSCYLALYEDPAHPAGWARLILAYHDQCRMPLPADGQRFPATQLLPRELFPQERRLTLIVDALYFQETQLGLVLFEIDADSQFLHKTGDRHENPLRGEISSALQGAILMQRIQAHAAQIARQQYILDTFMANVPDAIYFKDAASRFIHVNQALARALKVHAPDELVGKMDFDFFPEAQARAKYEQEQRIIQTGQPVLALEEHDAQGRWALTTKMPLRDERGAIIGTFGISRDITTLKQTEYELRQYRNHLEDLVADRTTELSRTNTHLHDEIIERRRIEQALRVSEQQYRTLAENVTDGMIIVQADHLVFANQVCARMFDRPPESLTMNDLSSFWRLPDSLDCAADRVAAPLPRQQAALLTRAGRTVWIEIEPTVIEWNGQPAILLTLHDITDRQLREQRLEEERARLQQENVSLKSTIKERYRFGNLVGKSAAMQRIYELILNAASSEVNVLVVGESGTGKELIAQTMHQVSRRKTQAFVPVNCASIPETLFEREFFGHRKGAFTGADRDTPGLFDRAHRGTLFLDEVTELTPATQAKLLRVLQDGVYTPLGSVAPKQADVLIVAATNKDCQEEIARGRLRKDFFYRIGVIELMMPPLRERKEDLPLLIEGILAQYQQKQLEIHGRVPPDLPTDQSMLPGELVQAFYAYSWPGNVRELQNALQRYLATRDFKAVLPALGLAARSLSSADVARAPAGSTLAEAVQLLEKRMIAETLAHTGKHLGKTVAMLKIPRRTLQRKIKRYGL